MTDLLPEIPSAADGAAIYATSAQGSTRFGVSGDNIVLGSGFDDSPERIERRRAHAEQVLAAAKAGAFCGNWIPCSATYDDDHKPRAKWKRTDRKRHWKTIRWYEGGLEKMKNGGPGHRFEFGVDFEDCIAHLRNFKDADGESFFA